MASKPLPSSGGYFNDKMISILEGGSKKSTPKKNTVKKPTSSGKKGK